MLVTESKLWRNLPLSGTVTTLSDTASDSDVTLQSVSSKRTVSTYILFCKTCRSTMLRSYPLHIVEKRHKTVNKNINKPHWTDWKWNVRESYWKLVQIDLNCVNFLESLFKNVIGSCQYWAY